MGGIVLDIRGLASNVLEYSNTCSNYLLGIPYLFKRLFASTGSVPRLGVGALIYITIRTISHYRNLFARLVFRSGLSSDLSDLSKSLNCFLSFCFKTFM